ncbi:MAG: HEAT repeat domain-containing protein, partial [Armatimonadetes bacterium]|nr:HEAT repeat domain-containing protein [Armatimonadota bacterium]
LLWREQGTKTLNLTKTQPWKSPEYRAKWNLIAPLMNPNRKEPFTSQEIQLLRKLAEDEIWITRADALIAFSFTPDPKQQREAIRLATKRLKDPNPYVREMALIVLGRLKAKEALKQVLPLLADPDDEVRETARQVLERWGYKVWR